MNIYGPQIFIGSRSTCNNFCLFNICHKNKNVYAYVILCRLNTSSGGSRGRGGGGLKKNVAKMCFVNIDYKLRILGVLQKSSKHFLISIFFPPGEGGHTLPVPPPLGTLGPEE